MKTPIAIIISGIVIALSVVVSTKMYVDANKYTFVSSNDGGVIALTQDGKRYIQVNRGGIGISKADLYWYVVDGKYDLKKLP